MYKRIAMSVISLVVGSIVISSLALAQPSSTVAKHFNTITKLPDSMATVKAPQIEKPSWVVEHEKKVRQEQLEAQQATAVQRMNGGGRIFTYSVITHGTVRSSLAEFRSQAAATLADARGWPRAGVQFQEVVNGGMFNLVLVEAMILDTIPGCSSSWSCRAGVNVYINDDRWESGTAAWNAAGGSLRGYRHMVINHEVGHWLGHEHEYCALPGQPAPVMQQQSIDLMGCTFNPWPLGNELWIGR